MDTAAVYEQSARLLDWSWLQEQLASRTQTPWGYQYWSQPWWEAALATVSDVRSHLQSVDALKVILGRYGEVNVTDAIDDVTPGLKRLEKGGQLDGVSLGALLGSLKGSRQFTALIRRHQDDLEELGAELLLTQPYPVPQEVMTYLEERITVEGDVLELASEVLYGLRQRLALHEQELQEQLRRYMRRTDVAQALQENTVTQRDGRFVLAVKVEQRSVLGGVVRDTSSTGSTLYVEPPWLVEANNRHRAIHTDIEREVQRILQEMSQWLTEHTDSLLAWFQWVGQVDRRYSAALLAFALNTEVPTILESDEPGLHLVEARHPQLALEGDSGVVANTVSLGKLKADTILSAENTTKNTSPTVRTMVITGPNTGGKTVLLKTIGLCALMVRLGLPIPVEEKSTLSLFEPILVDIGDEQSIAQNLSTFSASMTRLIRFIDLARQPETPSSPSSGFKGHSLVLVDEIAAGTDPVEGAALAEALLEAYYEAGALTVVTTHLGVLKLSAHRHPGFMNASMLFDGEKLEPTYRLLPGIPGSSNALIIAQRLGLPQQWQERAQYHLSQQGDDSAALLQSLEERHHQLEKDLTQAKLDAERAQLLKEQVETEYQELRNRKRQMLLEYRSGLKSRLHYVEDQIKRAKKDLKKHHHEAAHLQSARQSAQNAAQSVDGVLGQIEGELRDDERMALGVPSDEELLAKLEVGQEVESVQGHIRGVIHSIQADRKRITVSAGSIQVELPLSDVRPVLEYVPKFGGKSQFRPKKVRRPKQSTPSPSRKRQSQPQEGEELAPLMFADQCDVRGHRVSEAVDVVDAFLNKVLADGADGASIIHGRGTGALRDAIRHYLSEQSFVESFTSAEPHQGGDGQTLVVFQ